MSLLELDALGDELLMDDDSSYLDEASTAPSIPEGVPGDKSTNRVRTNINNTKASVSMGRFYVLQFYFFIIFI